jgi:lysophospholipase L1-like esterase
VLENAGPEKVMVGAAPGVTASINDGAIAAGASITAVDPVWVVSATAARLAVSPRRVDALDLRPHFQLAVNGAFRSTSMAPTPNRAYYSRFVPEAHSILTGIQLVPDVQSTGDPAVSFGIFDIDETTGEFRRLALISERAGRVNGTPYPDQISLAKQSVAFNPRIALQGGKPYYACVRVAVADATLTLAAAQVGREAMFESSMSHLVPGALQMFYDEASIPPTITRPRNIITEVPLMGLSYQRRITCLGDSITYAGGSVVNAYPRSLAAMLGRHAYVMNAGMGAETIALVNSRFDAHVTAHRPHDVVVLVGINDVQSGQSAAQIVSDLAALYAAIDEIGANVKAVTLAPWASYEYFSAALETVRLEVNDWIRTSAGVPYVDLESMGDGASPPALQAGYTMDGIHLSPDGSTEIARQVFTQAYGGRKAPRLSTTAG